MEKNLPGSTWASDPRVLAWVLVTFPSQPVSGPTLWQEGLGGEEGRHEGTSWWTLALPQTGAESSVEVGMKNEQPCVH